MSATYLPLHKRLAKYVHTLKSLTRQPNIKILPLLEQYVPKNGVIIDAGADTRQFTRLFAQAVPQGHVYAFEPRRKAYAVLAKVIASEKLQNVSLFPMGLRDKPSEDSLAMLTGTSGGGCPVMKGKTGEEKIVLTTLDLFASRHTLKRIDFIRAGDIRMLHGARQVIEKFKPVLFLADNNEELRNFLKALNYRIENDAAGNLWCVAEERLKDA